ncbi:hypothetical protein K402DRAFT_543 [Aulographum hederae CBS 113979]|uniref:Uncharacterized protein n=1 Tax=Aulographum hederae CBS 113979 TaxID=1176131 RepID=A0A6G1HGW9_9PEZI|nr:hypothetical protein K402DRAFT_543 [Aulographum hederae CBS 113979]
MERRDELQPRAARGPNAWFGPHRHVDAPKQPRSRWTSPWTSPRRFALRQLGSGEFRLGRSKFLRIATSESRASRASGGSSFGTCHQHNQIVHKQTTRAKSSPVLPHFGQTRCSIRPSGRDPHRVSNTECGTIFRGGTRTREDDDCAVPAPRITDQAVGRVCERMARNLLMIVLPSARHGKALRGGVSI